MRIAIVGAGIAGLAAALRLTQRGHRVTLFEANDYVGGHSNTVDVTIDGLTHPVDTGFLVFNHKTYPNLVKLFDELCVPTAPSEMSFAASVGPHRFEWCGTDLGSLFAQPGNAVSPRFWRMVRDILRFNRQATELCGSAQQSAAVLRQPLGEFLRANGYGKSFQDDYLLPMAAAIWSCPMSMMREFPLGTFVRFFHNHGLLQIENRPQWYTVAGGAREYVRRICARLNDVRTATPVFSVTRHPAGTVARIQIASRFGQESFDHAVLACHSDQALALLADAGAPERGLLGQIRYQPNRAYLHTDPALMPRRRRAWAAWNYLSDGNPEAPSVSVTYWLNRLQPLPFATPVLVSLNPLQAPADAQLMQTFDYEHPIFDTAAILAQGRLSSIQGVRNTWFAGAWTGYGFHEDALISGERVAEAIGELPESVRVAA
jgi:uncharacterized protein